MRPPPDTEGILIFNLRADPTDLRFLSREYLTLILVPQDCADSRSIWIKPEDVQILALLPVDPGARLPTTRHIATRAPHPHPTL